MTQIYKIKSSVLEAPRVGNLFSGIWIRWRALTLGERFVCANIIIIPIWAMAGLYQYMALILLLSVALYECLQHGKIRLKRPNSVVVTFFLFGLYEVARLFFFGVKVRGGLVEVTINTFCPAFWLWYIQANKIRIRIEVVAWACTVSVIQMLGFWLAVQFVLPKTFFPQPNLMGLLTGNTANPMYLLAPVGGSHPFILERFTLFFVYPEFFSVVAGFMGIVALDVKNRFWSWLLFLACVFLIFLSGTRIVWLTFPLVIALRYMFSNFSKSWVPPITFALIAVVSFTTLSIPPATHLVLNTLKQSTESVNSLRSGSTDVREEIYSQTWKKVQENPLWGNSRTGKEQTTSGTSVATSAIGTHSVILGNLLYQRGLVGTVIFISFWFSLFIWLYKTRAERSLTWFCMWIFYTLVSPTLELIYTMPMSVLMVLLCVAIRRSKIKPIQVIPHA